MESLGTTRVQYTFKEDTGSIPESPVVAEWSSAPEGVSGWRSLPGGTALLGFFIHLNLNKMRQEDKYTLLVSGDAYNWTAGGFTGNWKDTYSALSAAKISNPTLTYHIMMI